MSESSTPPLEAILESLLFVSNEPLKISQIRKVLPDCRLSEIKKALEGLKQRYAASFHGIELCEVDGGFRLQTKSSMRSYIMALKRRPPLKISRASLETLAIVAYKQPISRPQIEAIKGVDVSSSLKTLLRLRLIEPAGRQPGSRALLYKTTSYFLQVFGIKSLADLPRIEDI